MLPLQEAGSRRGSAPRRGQEDQAASNISRGSPFHKSPPLQGNLILRDGLVTRCKTGFKGQPNPCRTGQLRSACQAYSRCGSKLFNTSAPNGSTIISFRQAIICVLPGLDRHYIYIYTYRLGQPRIEVTSVFCAAGVGRSIVTPCNFEINGFPGYNMATCTPVGLIKNSRGKGL